MSEPTKVVRIEIEWDNGKVEGKVGEEANQIWKQIGNYFVLANIHGIKYTGPVFETFRENKDSVLKYPESYY